MHYPWYKKVLNEIKQINRSSWAFSVSLLQRLQLWEEDLRRQMESPTFPDLKDFIKYYIIGKHRMVLEVIEELQK